MKIKSSKTYMYKYDYQVDGQTFTGKLSEKKELTNPMLEVIYNPDSPESVTNDVPCDVYEKIKAMPGKRPWWLEVVGAGLFLLSLGFLKNGVVKAIKGT